jgi:hypothetical protein
MNGVRLGEMLPFDRIVFSGAPFISFNPCISTAFDGKEFYGHDARVAPVERESLNLLIFPMRFSA